VDLNVFVREDQLGRALDALTSAGVQFDRAVRSMSLSTAASSSVGSEECELTCTFEHRFFVEAARNAPGETIRPRRWFSPQIALRVQALVLPE